MQKDKSFENDDFFKDEETSFFKILEKSDLKDIFILSEILNNAKFDQ